MSTSNANLLSQLHSYLRRPFSDAQSAWFSGHRPGEVFRASELPPFHQGGYIIFNASGFTRNLGITSTQKAGRVFDALVEDGVETRQTVTVRIGGERRVIKAARVRADTLLDAEHPSEADNPISVAAQADTRTREHLSRSEQFWRMRRRQLQHTS